VSGKLLVVIQDIPFGDRGVFAYRAGDKVSEETVKANKWEDFVSAENTKAAESATDVKGK
jgi:hypothetical protein